MDRRRRDFEVTLEVSLRRWTTIRFRVRVEEGEVLALQVRELSHLFVTSDRQPLLRPLKALGWAPACQGSFCI